MRAANGKIYAIGGYSAKDRWTSGAVEEYDLATDTWTARLSMPTARDRLEVGASNNGRVYAIGGLSAGRTLNPLSIVEEYDPATNSWTTRASMPTARFDLGVAAAPNGKIYAIEGHVIDFRDVSTVEEYDPAADTWTMRARMPTG